MKRYFLLVFLLVFGTVVFATPGISDWIGGVDLNDLKANGSVKKFYFSTNEVAVALLSDSSVKSALLANIGEQKPSVAVEALYYLRDTRVYGKPEEQQLRIYNILRSISSLEGIQYYSASRKTMRIFYAESYVIDSFLTKKRLPDPLVKTIPEKDVVDVHQRDLTFGANDYEYDYRSLDGAIAFFSSNVGTIHYLIFPVIGPRKLNTTVLVVPAGQDILLYVFSSANAMSIPGLNDRLKDSFSNRADALFSWFKTKVNG
jgi:hypothetical protein